MRNTVQWMLAVCVLVAYAVMAAAQTPSATEYVLGPDDVIEIIVINHAELNKIATITRAGTIAFAEIGEVKAAGLTAKKLAANIQTELEKTLNNVSVSVTVKEVHPTRYFVNVFGASKTSGLIEIRPRDRLVNMIAAAGGLNGQLPLIKGRIIRGENGGNTIFLNVPEAIAHPDGPANVIIQPGDIIYFDEVLPVHPQVKVQGQVEKPGMFEIDATTSLSSILTQAGGPLPKAALNKSFILRQDKRIPVDLTGPAAGIDPTGNGPETKLQPDDILVVAENTVNYIVIGETRATGKFPYPATGKVTLSQAFTQAGGPTTAADLKNAQIVRFPDGKMVQTKVDLNKIMAKNSKAVDPTLEPGDILYVPTKNVGSGSSFLNSLLTPLSLLSVLGLHL